MHSSVGAHLFRHDKILIKPVPAINSIMSFFLAYLALHLGSAAVVVVATTFSTIGAVATTMVVATSLSTLNVCRGGSKHFFWSGCGIYFCFSQLKIRFAGADNASAHENLFLGGGDALTCPYKSMTCPWQITRPLASTERIKNKKKLLE